MTTCKQEYTPLWKTIKVKKDKDRNVWTIFLDEIPFVYVLPVDVSWTKISSHKWIINRQGRAIECGFPGQEFQKSKDSCIEVVRKWAEVNELTFRNTGAADF
jgi:hypothetical protein